MAYPRSTFQHRRGAGLEPRDVPWIVTLMCFAALCVAWIAEYGGGLAPCELCMWQRYGYWAAIGLGAIAMFYSRRPKARKFWLWLTTLALLTVSGIALFHVGVEQGWWQGTSACIGVNTTGMTQEQMTEAIMNAPVTRCDEPAFVFLGISIAGYNGLYALALGFFALWGATRRTHR